MMRGRERNYIFDPGLRSKLDAKVLSAGQHLSVPGCLL
jgi:hypothetical protein